MTNHSFGCNSNEGGVCNCEGEKCYICQPGQYEFTPGGIVPVCKKHMDTKDYSNLNDHIIDDTQENALGNFHIEENQDPLEDKLRNQWLEDTIWTRYRMSQETMELIASWWLSKLSQALHSDRERVREEVEKIKQWVFTSSFGLEMEESGKIIPRKREDGSYIKVSDLKAVLSIITHNH